MFDELRVRLTSLASALLSSGDLYDLTLREMGLLEPLGSTGLYLRLYTLND